MTTLKIEGTEYPAKITMGVIKRAVAFTKAKGEEDLWKNHSEDGLPYVVWDAIRIKNEGFTTTYEQFLDLLSGTEIIAMFTELQKTDLPQVPSTNKLAALFQAEFIAMYPDVNITVEDVVANPDFQHIEKKYYEMVAEIEATDFKPTEEQENPNAH